MPPDMLTLLPDTLVVSVPSYPDVTLSREESETAASSLYFVTDDAVRAVVFLNTVIVADISDAEKIDVAVVRAVTRTVPAPVGVNVLPVIVAEPLDTVYVMAPVYELFFVISEARLTVLPIVTVVDLNPVSAATGLIVTVKSFEAAE